MRQIGCEREKKPTASLRETQSNARIKSEKPPVWWFVACSDREVGTNTALPAIFCSVLHQYRSIVIKWVNEFSELIFICPETHFFAILCDVSSDTCLGRGDVLKT